MSTIFFCADDYALNRPISQAIVQLIEDGRLQATACMTQSPFWEAHGAKLREVRGAHPHTQVGLHFNLTHNFSDDMLTMTLGRLMLDAWLFGLSHAAIEKTLAYQWQRFIDVMGRTPDFIDGHQHVHQFPVIREVLLTFLTNKGFSGWIRNLSHTVETPSFFIKSKMLSLLGARTLASECEELHFKQNARFGGIYDFSNLVPYPTLVQYWLSRANTYKPPISEPKDVTHGLLIMCHPAVDQSDPTDVISAARVNEFNYLASHEFIQDCVKNDITFTQFTAKRSGGDSNVT
jgi:predicted glycoside hydrolase/deacetylase ChbG (UPF0249 family)